jgi:Fe2+ transport system protein FeoA
MIDLKTNLKEKFLISEAGSDNDLMELPDLHSSKGAILLKSAMPGKKYIIDRIIGGHVINGRLNAMGIVPNEVITVIFQTWGGPLTIAVKGVRVALGRGITHKIEVSELSNGQRE